MNENEEFVIELAFYTLTHLAHLCGIQLFDAALDSLPTQQLTVDFQTACHNILLALKKP